MYEMVTQEVWTTTCSVAPCALDIMFSGRESAYRPTIDVHKATTVRKTYSNLRITTSQVKSDCPLQRYVPRELFAGRSYWARRLEVRLVVCGVAGSVLGLSSKLEEMNNFERA